MKAVRIIAFLLFTSFVYTGSASAGFEGGSNTFYGTGAGTYAGGDNDACTFIGRNAGYSNTIGSANTFLGLNAGGSEELRWRP